MQGHGHGEADGEPRVDTQLRDATAVLVDAACIVKLALVHPVVLVLGS